MVQSDNRNTASQPPRRGTAPARPRHSRAARRGPSPDPAGLLDRINDGLVALDRAYRYTLVNRHAAAMLGRSVEELIGHGYYDLFPEAVGTPFERAYARAMDEQVPLVVEDYYEPWDRWFENRIYPLGDGIAILFTEITERKRAERLLAFHAELLEQVPEAVLATDADRRIVYWSRGAEQLFGWGAQEVLGRPLAEVVVADEVERNQLMKAIRREGVWQGTSMRTRRDGSTFQADISISARQTGAHGFGGIIEIIVDRSERARTERALAERTRRLDALHAIERAILAARSPRDVARLAAGELRAITEADAVIIARIDADGGTATPVATDGHVTRTVGMRRWTLTPPIVARLGQGAAILTPSLAAAAASNGRIAKLVKEGWRSELTVPLMRRNRLTAGVTVMYRETRADLEQYVEIISETAGAVTLALEEAELRTRERVSHENAVRTARRLALLHEIDAASLRSTTLEALGHDVLPIVRDASDAVRVALSVIEAPSMARLVAVDGSPTAQKPGDRFALRADLMPILDAGQMHEMPDLASLAGTAEIFDVLLAEGIGSIVTIPLRIEGSLLGLLAVGWTGPRLIDDTLRDTLLEVADDVALALRQAMLREENAALLSETSRHAAELEDRVAVRTAELSEINSELDAFSYSVSHDLRAPLRAMHGFADALLEDEADRLSDAGRGYADRIVGAAGRMEVLIEDLLEYGRLSRAHLKVTDVSLDDVVAEALHQLEPSIAASRARIRVARRLGRVRGHRQTLVQVVANLVSNAIKYVPPERHPEVTIRAAAGSGHRRLWVEDDGIGIAPEHRERIFKPFERLHGVEAYAGTGIGLAVVRRALERMAGASGMESDPGRGSRFWIELPSIGRKP